MKRYWIRDTLREGTETGSMQNRSQSHLQIRQLRTLLPSVSSRSHNLQLIPGHWKPNFTACPSGGPRNCGNHCHRKGFSSQHPWMIPSSTSKKGTFDQPTCSHMIMLSPQRQWGLGWTWKKWACIYSLFGFINLSPSWVGELCSGDRTLFLSQQWTVVRMGILIG